MAPSRSEKQESLFDDLDGSNAAGVFYFPKTASTQADQVASVEITLRRIELLTSLVNETKFPGIAAPKITDLLRWLHAFERDLRTEREKLLALNGSIPEPTPKPTSAVVSDAR